MLLHNASAYSTSLFSNLHKLTVTALRIFNRIQKFRRFLELKIKYLYCAVFQLPNQLNTNTSTCMSEPKHCFSSYHFVISVTVLRSCIIEQEELEDGLRVLVFKDGLFYEGAVQEIRPPDVYGVLIDNERGNRPIIYSQEEILKDAVRDAWKINCINSSQTY